MFAFSNFTESMVIGHLGNAPALNYVGKYEKKQAVCRFRLAANQKVRQEGVWVDTTEWHNVVLWQRDAEMAARYLKKGSAICVKGRNESRRYTDKEGQTRTITELVAGIVVSLDGRRGIEAITDDTEEKETESLNYRPVEHEQNWNEENEGEGL